MVRHGTTLAEILVGYHLANYFNDPAIGPRYGYGVPELEDRRVRDTPSSFALHVDGSMVSQTDTTEDGVNPGAVRYYVWDDMRDFALYCDALGGDSGREHLQIRAVLERGEAVEIRDISPGPEEVHFEGGFDRRIAVITVHVAPRAGGATVRYAASWSPPSTAVEDAPAGLPSASVLHANYPNPFNPVTTIRYEVHRSAHVTLEIYDVLGQRVRRLVNGVQAAGAHTVGWDGRNETGEVMPSGVYVARMQVGRVVQSRAMLLIK